MTYELPTSDGVLIPGKRGNLFGHLYLPGGPYPRPVVLIAHGIPGNERLFDFSLFLREHGFCTVNFHYSGSWGSDGDYSIPNCFEDIASAAAYIERNENGWFDLNNFFVLGHSMGGLMGACAISTFSSVRGGALLAPFNLGAEAQSVLAGDCTSFMEDLFTGDDKTGWLRNFSREDFVRYLTEDPARFDLTSYAAGLARKPVMVLTGTRDSVCPADVHGGALCDAIKKAGGTPTQRVYETDHCMNTLRGEIRQDVTDFLLGLIN